MDGVVSEPTVAEVGEFALIDRITAVFGQGEQVLTGPGDDAAVVRIRNGHIVVSTDLFVEDRHFKRAWAEAGQIGHRAAAQSLSDINAMGGRAHTATLGLAVPADLPVAWVEELARGFAEECGPLGVSVVGGDITRANEIVLAVTVIGACTVAPVLRSGAKVGDVVALRGRQGWSAAGLAVLTRGFRSPRALVEAYQAPKPPYDAGPEAAEAGATAMIDVSDGLLADLGHIARASGVSIDVSTSSLDIAEPLQAVGAALGVDPLQFVLAGGEDHPLAATFSGDVPDGWVVIGRCVAPGEDGPEVTVDGAEYDGPRGHTHF